MRVRKSMKINKYEYYCTGCGLCCSEYNAVMYEDNKGFRRAHLCDKEKEFCEKICPASGNANFYLKDNIWGPIVEVWGAYASNINIRTKASSGGVLTAIACYLLSSKQVDGIIQTRCSEKSPYGTEVICSTTEDEVLKCCGSRYSVASPLQNLRTMIKKGKKYAVIARPCDILALRSYMNMTGKYKDEIVFLLSFFCAGTPSNTANTNMLNSMGVEEEKCVNLQYRGNGWPGYTIATQMDGSKKQMEYKVSWGKYLGRDILPICRLCMDGTGSAADFSCGDYWELKDGKPDFSEHEGRNMVLVRTERGKKLLEESVKNGIIELIQFKEGKDHIEVIQPAQYARVTTLGSQIKAMKLVGRAVPNYKPEVLRRFQKNTRMKERVRIFIGTLKRIRSGKI